VSNAASERALSARRTARLLCLVAIVSLSAVASPEAETLPEALVKAYQSNPQLNADRARQRGTDENVPQALAGYRPQIVASLSAGLQAVRNLLPDNAVQSATLRPWTIGVTVSQVLFNGFKTANSVRVAEFQVQSGREALRNTGQGVLLDAVTVYMNVLANQALVESQRTNVAVLREIQATTKKRLDAGDVTPTDTAQAEARLSRGLADLNAVEVALAISRAIYTQVIGDAPSQLIPATPVDRLSPTTLAATTDTASHEHPAVLGAGFDVDVAQTTIKFAESSLLPTVAVQANASRSMQSDSSLTTTATDQASILGQIMCRFTMAAPQLRKPGRPRRWHRRAAWCWNRSEIRRELHSSAHGCPTRQPRLRSRQRSPKCALRALRSRASSARRRGDNAQRSMSSIRSRI
jgi:outer membrane protein